MNRGFTVIEVLVTLVVIAVLLGLGTVGVRATLANGRDAERKSDIEAIARGLERRYERGNTTFVAASGFFEASVRLTLGRDTYPGVNEFLYGKGDLKSEYAPDQNLQGRKLMYDAWGFSKPAATTPSGTELVLVCDTSNPSCMPAENATQLAAVFAGTNRDKYAYEPINQAGSICNSANFTYDVCTRFNLYWISETDQTPYLGVNGLKVLRSKHQ